MNVAFPEIMRATGLSERSVRRWIARLDIVPAVLMGAAHFYAETVIPDIQAAMLQAAAARGDAIRAALSRPAVITTREAKRRAGRGAK